LAKVQVAAKAAGEAAAQSAAAVGLADKEVSKLAHQLSQVRAGLAERSRGLTSVTEDIERSRYLHRRAESELDALTKEAADLQQACKQAASASESRDVDNTAGAGGKSAEVDHWTAIERRTETLPREQMLLLQHLRGSQRGGSGAGIAGNNALEALRDLREQQLLQAGALSAEENLLCAELQRTMQASLDEMEKIEHRLRFELETVGRDRQLLRARLENGHEERQASEQQLRQAIQRLNDTPEAKDAIDDGTIARMAVVMREAQKFLYEQQQRLDDAERERDEVKKRLLDTLTHLEGPEYAELVVATAIRAAFAEQAPPDASPLEESDPPGTIAEEDLQAQWLSGRRSRSPAPWQPPPTIVEEEEQDPATSPKMSHTMLPFNDA
jgi:hypothetical protein